MTTSGAPRKTAATKDPAGGLTATGRAEFARKQGAHLKPGVTQPESEMTPEEMRRKGSWAARFYGRKTLPPLRDAKGEPVPATEAEARKIPEKGRRLLSRYQDLKKARK